MSSKSPFAGMSITKKGEQLFPFSSYSEVRDWVKIGEWLDNHPSIEDVEDLPGIPVDNGENI